MKKGINIWSFPAGSTEDCLRLAKDAGFEGVELALGEEGEISLASTEKELRAVRAMAEESGLALYSLSCGLYWKYWLNADDASERERAKYIVRRQLEAAAVLGADTVLVLAGCVNADFEDPAKVVSYGDAYERSLEALQELKGDAEKIGVSIALENVWSKFLLSPIEMRDFIDKIASPAVRCYFDVGNAVANGYPEHWIEILGERIKKVHFKDYRRAAGGLHGFVDLLAGDVNYPAVMDALRAIGYDGWCTAEMIPNYRHYTDAILYNTSYSMDRIFGGK